MAKREGFVGWTRNMDWEVTEIQRTAEDVSCHYLYLRRTQPQPQTVFAQIQNTDLPAAQFIFFFGSTIPPLQKGPFLSSLYLQFVHNMVSSLLLKSILREAKL